MSRYYLDIGSSPSDEDCVQVGTDDYARRARIECIAFIEALIKKHGEPPANTTLRVKGNPHDFGTYYEVVCDYDPDDETSAEYAFKCEGESPLTWEEVGMSAPAFD